MTDINTGSRPDDRRICDHKIETVSEETIFLLTGEKELPEVIVPTSEEFLATHHRGNENNTHLIDMVPLADTSVSDTIKDRLLKENKNRENSINVIQDQLDAAHELRKTATLLCIFGISLPREIECKLSPKYRGLLGLINSETQPDLQRQIYACMKSSSKKDESLLLLEQIQKTINNEVDKYLASKEQHDSVLYQLVMQQNETLKMVAVRELSGREIVSNYIQDNVLNYSGW